MVATYGATPGEVLEIDGMQWVHPVTGRHCRAQLMVDVGSRCPAVKVLEETPTKSFNNNSAPECRDALINDWLTHKPRPKVIRLDPDGAYVSNVMLEAISGLQIDVQVTPPEAPWHLSVLGIVSQLFQASVRCEF